MTKSARPTLTKAEMIDLSELRFAAFEAALNYARFGFARLPAIPPDERDELFKAVEFANLVERHVNRKSESRHVI